MKKLVIFSTLTGNTEKIANAIFSVIEGDKELLNVKDSDKINPDDYDKIIVGYWVDKGDADEKISSMGIPCFACNPEKLPLLLERVLKGLDLNSFQEEFKKK